MRDLKCGLRTCEYNHNYNCNAKKINVAKGTDCLTYEKSAKMHESALFEAGIDFAPSDYGTDTKVACDADCLFNRNRICIANGITVLGEGKDEPLCMTFIAK